MALPDVAMDRPDQCGEELAPKAPGGKGRRDSIIEEERAKSISRLAFTRIAMRSDEEFLSSANKQSIHSVKVLGEGAFGIVDLVLVDYPIDCGSDGGSERGSDKFALTPYSRGLLCVRKKLLKQTKQNNNDPSMEVRFYEECCSMPLVVQMWSHVVGLYDYTLLLEYCPYGSLAILLKRVKSPPVLPIQEHSSWIGWFSFFRRNLKTVAHAFLAQNTTRDIKPDNLLIAENRYCKLGDLGLVKELEEGCNAHSHAGTPGYMAPEIVHSKGSAGAQEGEKGYSWPADM
eukprot:gene24876-10540_t